MVAMASLHAHELADAQKGAELTNMLYMDAQSRISYLTGGLSGEDAIFEERMKLVRQYQELRQRATEGKEQDGAQHRRTTETPARRHLRRSRTTKRRIS
jgi:hypothetical protein